GSVDELDDFMESFSTKFFKRTAHYDQKKRWTDLEDRTEQLKELGLVKDTLMGPVLTDEGQAMKKYLINHKCELEAEMRRKTRRSPGKAGKIRQMGAASQKVSSQEFTNR